MTAIIYSERDVPAYTLPDVRLDTQDRPIRTPAAWRERRQHLLDLFSLQVYGRTPSTPVNVRFEIRSVAENVLDGSAIRKEVRCHFSTTLGQESMEILLYLPANANSPVPLFLGLNFFGNHAIHSDPAITISDRWMRKNNEAGIVNHRATEATRGMNASRWPIERILDQGYGLATIYCGDLDPDFDDGFQNGIHTLFERTGQPDDWEPSAHGLGG